MLCSPSTAALEEDPPAAASRPLLKRGSRDNFLWGKPADKQDWGTRSQLGDTTAQSEHHLLGTSMDPNTCVNRTQWVFLGQFELGICVFVGKIRCDQQPKYNSTKQLAVTNLH